MDIYEYNFHVLHTIENVLPSTDIGPSEDSICSDKSVLMLGLPESRFKALYAPCSCLITFCFSVSIELMDEWVLFIVIFIGAFDCPLVTYIRGSMVKDTVARPRASVSVLDNHSR